MNQFKEFVSQISTKILCYSRLANNKSHQTFMCDEEREEQNTLWINLSSWNFQTIESDHLVNLKTTQPTHKQEPHLDDLRSSQLSTYKITFSTIDKYINSYKN